MSRVDAGYSAMIRVRFWMAKTIRKESGISSNVLLCRAPHSRATTAFIVKESTKRDQMKYECKRFYLLRIAIFSSQRENNEQNDVVAQYWISYREEKKNICCSHRKKPSHISASLWQMIRRKKGKTANKKLFLSIFFLNSLSSAANTKLILQKYMKRRFF